MKRITFGTIGGALALAVTASAQTKVVGWGPIRLDSDWAGETFAAVEAGFNTTVAVRPDGSVAAWGTNGGPFGSPPPLAPGVTRVDVAVGVNNCAARLSDGTIARWPDSSPLAYGSPVVQLEAGLDFFLAVLADGSLRGFGPNNSHGQATVPVGNNWVAVAGGQTHSLALRNDGVVVAFGQYTQGAIPPPGRAFVQITAGKYFNAGLLDDGNVVLWSTIGGALTAPALPPGTTYTKVEAGPSHVVARRSDGSAIAWEPNSGAELALPALPPGTTYVDVSGSGNTTNGGPLDPLAVNVLLRSDGRVVGAGWDVLGHLNVPALPAGLSYVQVSASGIPPDAESGIPGIHGVALRSDGAIVPFGDTSYGLADVPPLPPGVTYVEVVAGGVHNVARRSDGRVVDWGSNAWSVTNGTPTSADFVAVAAGAYFNLGLRANGTIAHWGFPSSWIVPPPLPPGVTYVQIDVGINFGLARRSDGNVVAWGPQNDAGQLNVPPLPPGVTYVDISAGHYHSLARRSDGVVVGWGANVFGSLNIPPLPPGVTYVELAAGHPFYNSARRSDGQIQVWGDTSQGKLDVPPLLPGQRYAALSAGYGRLTALVETVWSPYGTGKVNSLGCTPAVRAFGEPSASGTSGFAVECVNVKNQAMGMLIYTVNGQRASTPFQCASLLVGPSGIRRTPIRSSHGNPAPPGDCSGVFSLDMNAYGAGLAGGSPHPALAIAGTVVHGQWWGRDNGYAPPCNTMLSNAIEYVIGP